MSDFDWTFAEGQSLEERFRAGTPHCSLRGAQRPWVFSIAGTARRLWGAPANLR